MPERRINWLTRTLTQHNSVKAYLEPVLQLFHPQWQATGFQATVTEIRKENQDVFSLILKPQNKWPEFLAGQHISITVEINGAKYHRTFSISSSPAYYQQTGLIELTIRKQDLGKVTNYLNSTIKPGNQLTISKPQGSFLLTQPNEPLLFIAGGSGITPFRSFIQQGSVTQTAQDIHLIYYHNTAQALFSDEWSLFAAQMPNLKVSIINTRISGHISKVQLLKHCTDIENRKVFLCGPFGLIEQSKDILLTLGLSKERIKQELFNPRPITQLNLENDPEVYFSSSKVQAQSNKTNPKTLLELAEKAQVNPPSGCRMGVCHQCKCRKKQGIVYNTLTGQFSDTGEQDIQLCISLPVGHVNLEL